MKAKALRHTALTLHAAIGLLAGLLLIIVSTTGAAIVFHHELDHVLNPNLWVVAPQPSTVAIDQAIATAQAIHPGQSIQSVLFPKSPDEALVVTLETPQGQHLQTFMDPYTGRSLGSRLWEQSLMGFLYTLHYKLWAGKPGQLLVGITGILLLLMALTGLLLWRGWYRLAHGLTVRWHAPAALRNYDLHNLSGVLSSVLLAIIAITGIAITGLHLQLPPEEPQASLPPELRSPLPLSSLLAKSEVALPGGRISMAYFPPRPAEEVTIRKHFPDQQTGRFDLSTVTLNRYTGAILRADKVLQATGLFQVKLGLANFHFGSIGGLPTRILYVGVGLTPLLLFGTGLSMYQHRKWKKAQRQTSEAEAHLQDTQI